MAVLSPHETVAFRPQLAAVPCQREYLPKFRYSFGSFPEGAVAEGD